MQLCMSYINVCRFKYVAGDVFECTVSCYCIVYLHLDCLCPPFWVLYRSATLFFFLDHKSNVHCLFPLRKGDIYIYIDLYFHGYVYIYENIVKPPRTNLIQMCLFEQGK